MNFYIIKINNFWGDLTDVSAKKEALKEACLRGPSNTGNVECIYDKSMHVRVHSAISNIRKVAKTLKLHAVLLFWLKYWLAHTEKHLLVLSLNQKTGQKRP